jgi:hypothetical protein
MQVEIEAWVPEDSEEDTENSYFVMVTGIPTSKEHDDTSVPLVDGLSSREEAEIYAEVFRHYIATFPNAEHRLRQLANRYAENEADETVAGQDQFLAQEDVARRKFEN